MQFVFNLILSASVIATTAWLSRSVPVLAGFIVALTGQVLRMPGLPRKPQAEAIDLVDGVITGLR